MPNEEIITVAEMKQLKELLHKYDAFGSVASFVDGDIQKRRAVCD